MILVTGGAGFIGSNFVLDWLRESEEGILNLDKLTYAANLDNLKGLESDDRHRFVQGDIADGGLIGALLEEHRPRAVVNVAAESHVDRSIHGPDDFIQTNVVGTFRLLESVRAHWETLSAGERDRFRFLHVSTDEVYGSLGPDEPAFTENHRFAPNNPYAASKASSDHLVRAYAHTYGLPVVTSNCSNNYGPFQFPEKLIPLMIHNAISGKALPVYGDGLNVRDWLFVLDHCRAIRLVLERGRSAETYNVGGDGERTNLQVVRAICEILDELHSDSPVKPHADLMTFVPDRAGHDRRYAIDSTKLREELGWAPAVTFEEGLRRTVSWYLENPGWVARAVSGEYRDWIARNYGARRT